MVLLSEFICSPFCPPSLLSLPLIFVDPWALPSEMCITEFDLKDKTAKYLIGWDTLITDFCRWRSPNQLFSMLTYCWGKYLLKFESETDFSFTVHIEKWEI